MKRYLLFGGDTYYPAGGWGDFVGSYDTLEEAREVVAKGGKDWWDVIDGTTGESVFF